MTAKKSFVRSTSTAMSASISVPPRSGIRIAWELWWLSWKSLIRGQWVRFDLGYEPEVTPKKEIIRCYRHKYDDYYSCDYEDPWCVWSV